MDFKNPQQRSELATQLRVGRIYDQRGAYDISRSGEDYVHLLRGLQCLFEYIRTLQSNRVLDIGAGSTKAISQIASIPLFAKGLEFEAVTLKKLSEQKKYLGYKKTHITSAERLRGVPLESYGGVISVQGLAYSQFPKLVVRNIDSILVNGGVVKIFQDNGKVKQLKRQPLEVYEELFRDMGYDVWIEEVLLAIKGQNNNIKARELMSSDERTIATQLKEIRY
jgi:hypothetical protein